MVKSLMLRFDRFHHATEKAYLIQIGSTEHWVPKRFAWNLTINKKLGGHITVPAWLYEKITGEKAEDAPLSDAMVIVTHHKPELKEAVENNFIQELKK